MFDPQAFDDKDEQRLSDESFRWLLSVIAGWACFGLGMATGWSLWA